MRILHVSNLISPHQMPFAIQLAAAVGENNFRHAATLPMTAEMRKRGWSNDEKYSWILRVGENQGHRAEFDAWWNEADVVISGYPDIDRLINRVRRQKLTFYMSERWWKPPIGMARLLYPRFARMAFRFWHLAQSPLFHYLPMGVYAKTDMMRMASFHGRMWDWGYFTAVPDPLPPCFERKGPLRILWAGRMLAWKRVDTLVRAFGWLLCQNDKARLTLIGDGPCRDKLERLTRKLEIAAHVDFHATMSATQTREQMRHTHVYVLPSNAYEGWGTVLNEAMSEGCAVVASERAGSAKTLLRHGENGLLFMPGDYRKLAGLLFQLSADEKLRIKLAKAGQRTISECWSPEMAAERFLAVSDALLSSCSPPTYSAGPMSQRIVVPT